MPVLKQHHNTPAMREAIVLDLGDIGAQAARIRAAAETKAQQIIAGAQARAEENAQSRGDEAEKIGYADGLERGLNEGREQGHAEALAQSAEQIRQLSAAWSEVVTEWEQQRTEMEREARQAVIDFALRTAEKLVHRVIEVDESIVVDQVAQALSLVLSAHDASVRIHPVDRPMLEDAMPELLKELSQIEHVELIDDESITPGGCMVAFGRGNIDATIERQMSRLVDLILPAPPTPDYDESESEPEALPEQEASAIDVLPTTPESTTAPVYEITDQGLVPTQNAQPGAAQEPIDALADDDLIEDDEPESGA